MTGATVLPFGRERPFPSAEVLDLAVAVAIGRDLARTEADLLARIEDWFLHPATRSEVASSVARLLDKDWARRSGTDDCGLCLTEAGVAATTTLSGGNDPHDRPRPWSLQNRLPHPDARPRERTMPMNKPVFLALSAFGVALGAPLVAQSASPAPHDAFYCDERKLGTWFYCNSEEAKRKARERIQQQPAQSPPAVDRMAAITRQLDELKARAILEPTSENIVNYIRFQREQLDRASTFADVWSRAIWQNPELDYTLERPVSTLAKQTWLTDRRQQREGSMAALTQRYGVFYFYSSSCSACRTFSPVMRALSDSYGLEVLAVSMDGGPNEAFPNFVVDSGQYQRMGLQGGTVPALVLFDTQTKQPIPIGYGVMAADEVMQRIFYLTKIEPGSDY